MRLRPCGSGLAPFVALLSACIGDIGGASLAGSPDAGSSLDAPPTMASGPTISSFFAAPRTLPSAGMVTLSWQVSGAAAIEIAPGVGRVSGSSIGVTVTDTTTFTLTASSAEGSATARSTVVVGSGPGVDPPGGSRFAAVIAPVDGETFIGPIVDLRLIGVGRDENNFQGGPGGGRGQAASVQFFVDQTSVLTVDAASSEYWVFKGFATGLSLSPGEHTVFVRSFYTSNPGPAGQVDSRPVTITVEPVPTYAKTIDMGGDLSLAQAASWVGSPASRIRVNGNGHRIAGTSSSTPVTWQYVDFHDLGNAADPSANGIELGTDGNVTVQGCRFDFSNPVQLSMGGTATADIRGNLFRSNMRQPLGQLPYGDSFPAIRLTGGSSGAKTFAGNNVGAGWVDFQGVNRWTVGGDSPDDENVLIGPRVGIHFDYMGSGSSSNNVLKGNYSDHIYYGGWSQGNNLEAGGSSSLVAEHNVLISSSWTIRGMAGEFRYNLVLQAGEDWMWLDSGANVHHNLFIGGDNNRSGLYNTYGNTGIHIHNNTFDGLGGTGSGMNAILVTGSETVTSNLFMNVPYTSIDLESGTLTADYNLFWNSKAPAYSDSRAPAHDVRADPMLTGPAVHAYEFDERAVWLRGQTVRGILAAYRSKYTPQSPGSPAVDSGDPTIFGAGNDIGAIGNGQDNASDRFGL